LFSISKGEGNELYTHARIIYKISWIHDSVLTGVSGAMKKDLETAASVTVIMLLGLALFTESAAAASAGTTITVDPMVGGKAPGEFYSANITIFEVTKLVFWEFNLTFDTAILEAVSFVEGPFLKNAGSTAMPKPLLNNTVGFVMAACGLVGYTEESGVSGDGVLATIVFEVKAEGTSSLHFSQLSKRWPYTFNGETLISIPYTPVDGVFIYPVELVHDVAVSDIAVSSLTATIGETVSVNVTLLNRGDATESFDVTLYYDSTVIETQTVSGLIPDRSRTIVFDWETGRVAAGDYALTAIASAVDGETITLDNSFSFVAVKVTEPPPALPIELLGIAVVVVAGMIVAIVLFKRRSSKIG
jgi:hypothetical protein